MERVARSARPSCRARLQLKEETGVMGVIVVAEQRSEGVVREALLEVVPKRRRKMRSPQSWKLVRGEKQGRGTEAAASATRRGWTGQGGWGPSRSRTEVMEEGVGSGQLESGLALGQGPSDGAKSSAARGIQKTVTAAAHSSSARPGRAASADSFLLTQTCVRPPVLEMRRPEVRAVRSLTQSWRGGEQRNWGLNPGRPTPARSPHLLRGRGVSPESPRILASPGDAPAVGGAEAGPCSCEEAPSWAGLTQRVPRV